MIVKEKIFNIRIHFYTFFYIVRCSVIMNIYTYIHYYYIKKKSICVKNGIFRLNLCFCLYFIHLMPKNAKNAKKNGIFRILSYIYRIFVYAYIYLCILIYVFIIVSKTTRKSHKNRKNKNAKNTILDTIFQAVGMYATRPDFVDFGRNLPNLEIFFGKKYIKIIFLFFF